MPETPKELARRTIDNLLETLPAEELRKRLSPEQRLERLSLEERVKGLSLEELEALWTTKVDSSLPQFATREFGRLPGLYGLGCDRNALPSATGSVE
jgi:hypothetical protein